MDDIYISFWQLLFVNGLTFGLMFPVMFIVKNNDINKRKYDKDHQGYSDNPLFYFILYCIASFALTTFYFN